jgi:hypothetical protein
MKMKNNMIIKTTNIRKRKNLVLVTGDVKKRNVNNLARSASVSPTPSNSQLTLVSSNSTGVGNSNLANNQQIVGNIPDIRNNYNGVTRNAHNAVDDTGASLKFLKMYADNVMIKVTEIRESTYGYLLRVFGLPERDSTVSGMDGSSSSSSDSDSSMGDAPSPGAAPAPAAPAPAAAPVPAPGPSSAAGSADVPASPGQLNGHGTGGAMSDLLNGLNINQISFTHQFRIDRITYGNYNIEMQGIDNLDYRMSYDALIDVINNLNVLMYYHTSMVQLEHMMTPIINEVTLYSYPVQQEICTILAILSDLG